MQMVGIATEVIPFGAHVLCRGYQVTLAEPAIANGTAKPRPLHLGDPAEYWVGDQVCVDPIEGLGLRDLQAIADGPLMNPLALYLPAGRISLAEVRAREAANLRTDHD